MSAFIKRYVWIYIYVCVCVCVCAIPFLKQWRLHISNQVSNKDKDKIAEKKITFATIRITDQSSVNKIALINLVAIEINVVDSRLLEFLNEIFERKKLPDNWLHQPKTIDKFNPIKRSNVRAKNSFFKD